MTFRAPPRALLNLLAAGAVLRLTTLSEHSLWLDEGATWSWASRPTWGGTIFAEANHPPAWWVITRVWTSIFGDGEWALRAPAALLGVLTIFLCWRLGLRLFDGSAQPRRGGFSRSADPVTGRRAALWFAGFVAASTYFIEYAQEARMYSLLLAEAVGLSLLYLRWLDKGERKTLIWYALLAALALHTQYFALWPILGHASHALWTGYRTRGQPGAVKPFPFIVAVAGAGLLFVPWFLFMLANYEGISTGDPYEPMGRLVYVLWRIGAGPGYVVVDRARLEEGIPAVMEEEALTIGLTAIAWFIPVLVGAWLLRKERGLASFVFFHLVAPTLMVLAVFPFFPLIHERYLLFLAPWMLFLATYGALRASSWVRPLLMGGLLALFGVGLAVYFAVDPFLDPQGEGARMGGVLLPAHYGPSDSHPLRALDHGHPYGKEPWREAHRFVEAHAKPGDLVLLHPGYLHLVWDYYDRHKLERLLLPRKQVPATEIIESFGPKLAEARRVFLILAHEETEDPNAYFLTLASSLQAVWPQGERFDAVLPILFERSWGVRVAIFNRR